MNMNKALKRTSIAATLFILALMINLNYLQGTQADSLQKNPLNSRQYSHIFEVPRGQIIAADGTVLAWSQQAPNQIGRTKKYQRFYKDGQIFFPVTGYFASTGLTAGLESAYNGMLSGLDKSQSPQSWFDQFVGKPKQGANVYTTIDPKAQKVAYKKLQEQTDRRGGAVVIDIKTGAIKVAASYPSFDTNTVAGTTTPKQAADAFNAMTKQGNLKQGDINRAYGELFPPGSSFKTVVAATAFETGQYNENSNTPTPWTAKIPQSTNVVPNDPGSQCNAPNGQPLILSFAQSCNTTFAILGQQILGGQKVEDQAVKFGFTNKIEIEPDLKAAASIYPYDKGPDKVFLGSFGQGDTRATPLQMAMVAAAVANNGDMMKPYMVQNVKTNGGETLYSADPTSYGKPISSNTASQLQDMMKAVVANGTATGLRGSGLAGKTGTAELAGNNRGLWFIGYAPDNDPKIAFAVMIEGTKGDFGATKSGPVAKAIADQVLADMK
jgi:peptidoglycan glycosyltransferase